MKIFLFSILTFILILSGLVYSQSGFVSQTTANSFIIEYDTGLLKSKINQKENFRIIDYYEFTDPGKAGKFKLPVREFIAAIPEGSEPSISVKVLSENRIEDVIPAVNPELILNEDGTTRFAEVSEWDRNSAENELVQVLGYLTYRRIPCIHIRINPVVFDAGSNSVTEITSIQITFTFSKSLNYDKNNALTDPLVKKWVLNHDMAGSFTKAASFNKSIENDWIDYNASYLKIALAEDGIYRISGSVLTNSGIQISSIIPQNIRMFNKGEELAVFVNDGGDNTFDSDDFIEFYGEKNYSEGDYRYYDTEKNEYIPYLNRYSDSSFYFITWESGEGKRVNINSNFNANLQDTIDFYKKLIHNEKSDLYFPASTDIVVNQDPHWLRTDLWADSFMGIQAFTKFAELSDVVNTGNSEVYFKFVSYASNVTTGSHNIRLKVNGTVIDSLVADRNDVVLLGGEFNTDLLLNGNNQLVAENLANGHNINRLVYDWFEVVYPAKLQFVENNFDFTLNQIDNQTERLIKIGNAESEEYSIYQIKPHPEKITAYKVVNEELFFSDTLFSGYRFSASNEEEIYVPKILSYGKIVNLRNTSQQADYIAVTHPLFTETVDSYTSMIESEYGLSTKNISVFDIYNEFSFGYPEPESIQRFIKYAVENWQTPIPRYLFLIGSANYDYKTYKTNPLSKNLVPSFGEPVSDPWFVIWDSTGFTQPQLSVGRLPAHSVEEVGYYLTKHQNHLSQRFDEFNKRVLFFSGGNGSDPNQLEQLKSVNDNIINDITDPKPLSLQYTHFYKTTDPQSDFGPYSEDFIESEIGKGGITISYLGHSGTRIWDNGITEPEQLYNNSGKGSIVSDFGCSTNRFAEPDILAFGNLFVLDGQAIGYIGNSSLGFLNTSTTVSHMFYESMYNDSLYTIGEAHNDAKFKMFNRFGSGSIYRVFNYTNVLLGDPVITPAYPRKPNLAISQDDFDFQWETLNEAMNSAHIKLNLTNLGLFEDDTVSLIISDIFPAGMFTDTLEVPVPEYKNSIDLVIPVEDRPGLHNLTVEIDPENELDEIYEDDNTAVFNFNVEVLDIRPMLYNRNYAVFTDSLFFLNSAKLPAQSNPKISVNLSLRPDFISHSTYSLPFMNFKTGLSISEYTQGKRYYLRAKLEGTDEWTNSFSFIKSDTDAKIFISDSIGFSSLEMNGLKITSDSVVLGVDSIKIEVESGGGNVAKYGAVFKNGKQLLPNTFSWGMGFAVFDSLTMEIDTTGSVWYGDNSSRANDLGNFIASLPNGKIVAMCVIDDGSKKTTTLVNAVKTLGSSNVGSIGYRMPWALIGRKGLPPGHPDVVERIESSAFESIISIDTTFIRDNSSGNLVTPVTGPTDQWNNLVINYNTPGDSRIEIYPISVVNDTLSDTLNVLNEINGLVDLSSIDAELYPELKFLIRFYGGSMGESPSLYGISVDYKGWSELGVNYQSVTASADSLTEGEEINLSINVNNAGLYLADSVNVVVNLRDSLSYFTSTIIDTLFTGIAAKDKENISFTHRFDIGSAGLNIFSVEIDTASKIREFYKDNNYYEIPVYVKADTITNINSAALFAEFDGFNILDGEYISNEPEIFFTLNYESGFNYSDTSEVRFYLNGTNISYSNLDSIDYDTIARKITYKYTPVLKEGEYILSVTGPNLLNAEDGSQGYRKSFIVAGDAEILSPYNYPNPFSSNTSFTFRLTKVPDELEIRVYTISGRLIREFNLTPGELKTDFNSIFWDGRDQDGDLIANGVYIYKITLKDGTESHDVTQKLAVIR